MPLQTAVGSYTIGISRSRCRQSGSEREGFALIISLVLMSFIFLLLTSLSLHVMVSSQNSSLTESRVQAEQNALFALNMALGELAKAAGPDQRVTARADIIDSAAPYWTGVWSTDPDDPAYTSGSSDNEAAIKNREAIRWLVSEPNDGSDALLDQFGAKTTASMTDNEVLLASGGTAGIPVILSRQNITDPALNAVTGHYAYWVADEGIKASMGLDTTTASAGTDNINVRSPTRMGLEVMSGLSGYLPATGSDAFEETLARFARGQNLSNLPLALDTTDAIVSDNQHDLTHMAYGLPANVRDGGLKKDLTAAFQNGADWAQLLTHHGSSQLFTTIAATDNNLLALDPGGPFWEQLRSYYRLRPEDDAAVRAREQTDTQAGVYPVISHMSFHQHLLLYVDESISETAYRPRLCIFPVFVLWNPYDTAIAADTYYLKVTDNTIRNNKDHWNQAPEPVVRFTVPSTDPNSGSATETMEWRGNEFDNPEDPYYFRIDSPQIAPGEALIFSVNNVNPMPDHPDQPQQLLSGFHEGIFLYRDNDHYFDTSILNPNYKVIKFGLRMRSANYLRVRLAKSVEDLNNNNLLQFVGGQNYFFAGTGGGAKAYILWDATNDHLLNPKTNNDPQDDHLMGYELASMPIIPGHQILEGNGISNFPAAGIFMHLKMGRNYTEINNHPDFPDAKQAYIPYIKYLSQYNPRATRSAQSLLEQYGTTTFSANDPNATDMAFNPNYFSNAEIAGSNAGLPINHSYRTFNSSDTEVKLGHTDDPSVLGGDGWVLFEIPKDESHFLSVADLAHANLSQPIAMTQASVNRFFKNPSLTYNIQNTWPAYAIGNATPDPRVPLDRFAQGDWPDDFKPGHYHYDMSYMLNDVLWDDYFMSAYDGTSASPVSYNARYELDDGFTPGFDTSAAGLTIMGAFNVNSTSVEAWKAFLSSAMGAAVDHADTETYDNHETVPFLRVASPVGDPTPDDRDTASDEVYNGFLTLSEEDIDVLARFIVDQVKARGPFISMSHFINRVLDNATFRSDKETAYAARGADATSAMMYGTLQAAIHASGVNEESTGGTDRFNDARYEMDYYEPEQFYGNLSVEASQGDLAEGNPGYLTQLDLLDAIAPYMSVRSDTFTIRAYGDAIDPLTGEVDGRAWCVATVQRVVDYVDDAADAPVVHPDDLTGSDNQVLGRQFKIIDFQWVDEASL